MNKKLILILIVLLFSAEIYSSEKISLQEYKTSLTGLVKNLKTGYMQPAWPKTKSSLTEGMPKANCVFKAGLALFLTECQIPFSSMSESWPGMVKIWENRVTNAKSFNELYTLYMQLLDNLKMEAVQPYFRGDLKSFREKLHASYGYPEYPHKNINNRTEEKTVLNYPKVNIVIHGKWKETSKHTNPHWTRNFENSDHDELTIHFTTYMGSPYGDIYKPGMSFSDYFSILYNNYLTSWERYPTIKPALIENNNNEAFFAFKYIDTRNYSNPMCLERIIDEKIIENRTLKLTLFSKSRAWTEKKKIDFLKSIAVEKNSGNKN